MCEQARIDGGAFVLVQPQSSQVLLFLTPNKIVRMGNPPLRIEILTSVSGVDFDECYAEKATIDAGELLIPVISLARLRQNKAASGRTKDLADLENLPN